MANVGALCATCRRKITDQLQKNDQKNIEQANTLGGYLEDYIKMFMILSSDSIVKAKIGILGEHIASWGEKRGLSFHLKHFETRCRFPDVEVIPTGVLSADEFYAMIARGVMWKDVGAGLGHGLYAHRLQWHAVLAVITEGFTVAKAPGWGHGGYDLFVSLGLGEAKRFNIWGKVFDASQTNCFRAPEYVEPNLKGIKAVSSLIDSKYDKYHAAFKQIQNYAFDEAMRREKKPDGKFDRSRVQQVYFDITDAVWATYYFARRNIGAAIPADSTDYYAWVRSQRSWPMIPLVSYLPKADDASKRFREDTIVMEHNNKILRLNSQVMPTSEEVAARRAKSGTKLKTVWYDCSLD